MRIRAFPDTTGCAPASEAWHAYDIDSYDDCDERGFFSVSLVGTGATAEAAIADFLEQMDDAESDPLEDAWNAREPHPRDDP